MSSSGTRLVVDGRDVAWALRVGSSLARTGTPAAG